MGYVCVDDISGKDDYYFEYHNKEFKASRTIYSSKIIDNKLCVRYFWKLYIKTKFLFITGWEYVNIPDNDFNLPELKSFIGKYYPKLRSIMYALGDGGYID